MCRLFGVISTGTVEADFYVRRAPQALLVQSHVDRKRLQGDGWGVGWFEKGRPQVLKSSQPMYRDRKRLVHVARRAKGNALVGHVRWASNPLKLPKQELIGVLHSQPFSHGSWLFAHNGTLYIPREVKAKLGPWEKYVRGKNDSEVLFYWLLKTGVHRRGNPAARVRRSFRELAAIWNTCKQRYPLYKFPYHGVNWVLTNGRTLMAFCCVDPRGWDKAQALCSKTQPYYQLQVRQSPETLVVASEPIAPERDWTPMRHGELLVAQKTRDAVRVKRFQVF